MFLFIIRPVTKYLEKKNTVAREISSVGHRQGHALHNHDLLLRS